MSRQIPLNVSASVTLDNSGNGQVSLGPAIPGVTWYPEGAACIVSSGNSVPTFQLYLNSVGQSTFQGGSATGNNDAAGLSAVTLYPGMSIIGVWTGGDARATATMTLSGTAQVP